VNESFSHSGAWGVTLIVVVLVSWFFYRYFAPKNWREWAGAGVVQAFIIALYAEMYGFPLTVYLLVRFFGFDSQFVSASLWSTLVGLGETGMLVSMVLGYGLAFTGIAIFIQGWRQVHRARREDRLVTDGLYAFVRHPQYTGLFIALFGEGVIHWPTLFSVSLFPVIVGVYTWLARREEQQVLARFGDAYRAYQRRVPMFLPRPDQWRRFTDAARHPPLETGANRPIRAEHDVESEGKS
jgi:protein-S-isoprenylcysteine O-methyltransferase Ste14